MSSEAGNAPKKLQKFDIATAGGILVALAAIVGGLLLEGGQVRDISQLTAALIVLGGTLGAVMVNTPTGILIEALKRTRDLLSEPVYDAPGMVQELVDYAARARKQGIVSLESEAAQIPDPFLNKAMNLAIDGTELQEIRSILELHMSVEESKDESVAKVFECAGGYAPTIGIIGAVMGLIQVMKHLEDIKEVGHGIAVAFVATVYGVAVSNLILLPAAGKIRSRIQMRTMQCELILEGVLGIVEGLNPKLIERKLDAFCIGAKGVKKGGPEAANTAAAA